MKFLCVGYPKTGSKSCSSALRKLGFNVADYMETTEFLSFAWSDYMEGKGTIEDVISAYDKNGFDANQDMPGNFLWEDLYRSLIKHDANTKVILTVRDSDAAWWKSWCGFLTQEAERGAIGDLSLMGVMAKVASAGYLGAEFKAMDKVALNVCTNYLDACVANPGFSVKNVGQTYYWEKLIIFQIVARVSSNEKKLRQGYLKHNLYVQSIVPKDNLLIWNLKEGWAPLCAFLDKPIPDGPIPHDNRTGDTKFMEEYTFENELFKVLLIDDHACQLCLFAQRSMKELIMNLGILVVKLGLVGFIGYSEWKSGGVWFKKCIELAQQSASQLGLTL